MTIVAFVRTLNGDWFPWNAKLDKLSTWDEALSPFDCSGSFLFWKETNGHRSYNVWALPIKRNGAIGFQWGTPEDLLTRINTAKIRIE